MLWSLNIKNISGSTLSNLRIWIGTEDDWIEDNDSNKKERGNFVDGVFTKLTNASDKAAVLKVSNLDSGIYLYSTSEKTDTIIGTRFGFINLLPIAPSRVTEDNGDHSYAIYMRLNDLNDNESEDFDVYYAAGALADLADIANSVATIKEVSEDTPLTFSDSDFVDSVGITFVKIKITSLPIHGVLKLNSVNITVNQEIAQEDYTNMTYHPETNYSGDDSFTWQAWLTSSNNYSDDVAQNIVVVSVNDVPTITGTPLTSVAENSPYSFTAIGADIDTGTTLVYSISNKPTWATLNTSTGALTGTPLNVNVGTTSNIVISVSDGTASTSLASFNIEVTNTNDVPTSSNNSFTINIDEDRSKIFNSSDFTFTDNNIILDYIVITSLETAGSLKLNGVDVTLNQKINVSDISNLVFIPVANASGTPYAKFKFKVNDGNLNSTVSYTATINVNNLYDEDDIAIKKIQAYATDNTNPTPTVQDYIDAGVTDVDADNLNAVNAEIDASNTAGTDTLANIQAIIIGIDSAPTLEAIVDIDKSEDDGSFDITLNASDSDGDTISYEVTSSDTSIATVSESDGILTITPIANAHGVVTIEVIATANGKSDTESLTVSISAVNDMPTITIDENIDTDKNQAQVLTFSYTDADGDNIIVTTTTDPQNGTLTFNGSTITYTPYDGFSGSDSFILSFDDGNGAEVTKRIMVLVNPVNSETNITVASITHLLSHLKDTIVTVDEISEETTIIADSNITTELGFIYRAIVVIEKNGKSNTKIVRVNLATKEETTIDFTLKDGFWYQAGNSIQISIVNGMLEITIVTKINEPIIIN